MKLVFAHDHKLRKIGEKYFTVGGLRDSITNRYMEFFDNLIIFCRAIEKQPYDTQLFEITDTKIAIKPVSDGALLLPKNILRMMEEEIKNADGLVVKLHSKIAEYAIHFARIHNIPYLIEMVGDPWDSYWNHSFKGKLVAPVMAASTKKEVKRAPFVMYVTKYYLEERYPCTGEWISCSDVELQDIEACILQKRLRKINQTGNMLTLGTLAQVDVRYKGQEYVIRALAKLKKNGKIFKYKMAGSGENEYLKNIAIKNGVIDQIEFCGTLSHEDVFSWIDDIDLYIQPSKAEGLPRSMVEAISRACPAAGADVGGISELIDADWIFRKGNVNDIVDILESISMHKMENAAEKNFNTAQLYDKSILEEKRKKFYMRFAHYCKNRKNEENLR